MPAPIEITSLDDERVEVYRDVRDKDLRGRERFFMAESEMVIRRLLRTPERLHSLFLSHNKFERLATALQALPRETPVYVGEIDLISEIAGFHIHRGALAAGIRPSPEKTTLEHALGHLRDVDRCTIIIAERLTNIDNVGALFRNAAAFGADGIVLDPDCGDPLYRKSIRVSMGHTLSLPWAVCRKWPGDLQRLKAEWGVRLAGAEVIGGSSPLWRMTKSSKTALLFGSEGHGLSAAALAQCDEVCSIPMAEGVPSLNVAVASAVFLYELNRESD